MVDLADLYPNAGGVVRRSLNQAARELLLAQSSDWAFIIKTGAAVQYAVQRTSDHINRFNSLTSCLAEGHTNETELAELEKEDNIFPEIDYSIYSRHFRLSRANRPRGKLGGEPLKILMLSWEFPPKTIGGLARHVNDLSRALARLGENIHVITCPVEGVDDYQLIGGVHVHRVKDQDLAATIHATEYGRNRGIHNDIQRRIHSLEERLVNSADVVICCSSYMVEEITRLFGVTRKKLFLIPNGVDPANLGIPRQLVPGEKEPHSGGKTILFIGRLVPEKGVQVLLEAMPQLIQQFPEIKLLIGGTGPYTDYLEHRAEELGLAGKVEFLVFLDETQRNYHLKQADIAVFPSLYEPFGIVALEAMTVQIPVIVSDIGGLSEVVSHGIDGYKAPPGRPDILAYYIREILVNPGLAMDLTRRAWNKVLTVYDWNNIAVETLDVYREAGIIARGN